MGAYINIGHSFIWPAANIDEFKGPEKNETATAGDDQAYAVNRICLAFTPKDPHGLVENLVKAILGFSVLERFVASCRVIMIMEINNPLTLALCQSFVV